MSFVWKCCVLQVFCLIEYDHYIIINALEVPILEFCLKIRWCLISLIASNIKLYFLTLNLEKNHRNTCDSIKGFTLLYFIIYVQCYLVYITTNVQVRQNHISIGIFCFKLMRSDPLEFPSRRNFSTYLFTYLYFTF